MIIRAFNTIALEKYTEYRNVKEIIGLGIDADEDDKDLIRKESCTPMLNFKTNDGGHRAIPIELLIDIREDE